MSHNTQNTKQVTPILVLYPAEVNRWDGKSATLTVRVMCETSDYGSPTDKPMPYGISDNYPLWEPLAGLKDMVLYCYLWDDSKTSWGWRWEEMHSAEAKQIIAKGKWAAKIEKALDKLYEKHGPVESFGEFVQRMMDVLKCDKKFFVVEGSYDSCNRSYKTQPASYVRQYVKRAVEDGLAKVARKSA